MVLHEPRRCVRIEVLNDGPVTDVDLLPLDHGWHRHDDRKVLDLAFEIIRHRDDGPVFVADEHNLGRLVKKAGVGARHIETAKGLCRRCNDDRQHGGGDGYQDLHYQTPLTLFSGRALACCHW